MPKKSRPSMRKRERDFKKTQKQFKKAERAAAKRDKTTEDVPPESLLSPTPDLGTPPDVP